ncbi:hypothetical protein L1887_09928 [Cichorium endivia]|nr:hypothetical protein L1887_09928 [Cichorium endivia]
MFYKTKPTVDHRKPPTLAKPGGPVIGESIEFLATGWKGRPEKFIFDRMTKFSPHVFRTSLMLEDAAVFCGSAGNKFLFSNENKLVQAWWPASVDKIFPSSNQTSKIEAIKMRKMLPKKELVAIVKRRRSELAEGKASPTQDILSHMLLFSDEDGKFMVDTDIADKIIGLLIGGHDTASSACAFIVKYLAELPEIYEGIYKEQMEIAKSKAPGELLSWEDLSKMKYSWNVACEVLRLAPPLQGAFREAITDFMYNGYSIPKGWKLYWSANSTHKNPKFFPEPQKFDPSRFDGNGPAPYTFVPFGGGPRMCPGKEYARLEVLVFMHHLVTKFKWEKVIPNEQIIVNPMPSPAKGLPIRLYPHKNQS